jgi:hypothetical protein
MMKTEAIRSKAWLIEFANPVFVPERVGSMTSAYRMSAVSHALDKVAEDASTISCNCESNPSIVESILG